MTNAALASAERVPYCQDTGLSIVWKRNSQRNRSNAVVRETVRRTAPAAITPTTINIALAIRFRCSELPISTPTAHFLIRHFRCQWLSRAPAAS